MGRAVAAVPPRVAPLSTENLGSRGGVRRVSEAVGTCGRAGVRQRASAGISANGASNIPDSVDTTRVAAHGRSSQFRTGSTLGSPDQPSDFSAPHRYGIVRAVNRR